MRGLSDRDSFQRHFSALKTQVAAICQSPLDQILDHLLLAVNRHPLAGELHKRNSVPHSMESDLDSLMAKPLAFKPLAHPGFAQHLHAGVLQDPGSYSLLAIGRVILLPAQWSGSL